MLIIMGNPVFDWFIRRENFQLILIIAAVIWIFAVLIIRRQIVRREENSAPRKDRMFWILIGAIGPLVVALWFVYNSLMDHFGLDSVFALGINLVIFIAVGILIGLLLRVKSAS